MNEREKIFLNAGIPKTKIPTILSNQPLSDALLGVIREAGVEGVVLDKQQGLMFLAIASKLVPADSSQSVLVKSSSSEKSPKSAVTPIVKQEPKASNNNNNVRQEEKEDTTKPNNEINNKPEDVHVSPKQDIVSNAGELSFPVEQKAARIITRFFRVYKFRIAVLRSIHRVKKRFNCVHEILTTERHYVESLKAIQEIFEIPLRKEKIIPMTKIVGIFSNSHALYSFHTQFSSTLGARIGSWTARRTIADTFLPIIPFLKMYIDYVTRFDESHEILVSLRSNAAWNAFLEKRTSPTGLKGERYLSTLLISPVQRISRYELLLKEVAKNTGNDHEDFAILQEAVQAIHDVNLQINAAKKRADKKRQMEEVHKRLKLLGKNYEDMMAQANTEQEITESLLMVQLTVQKENSNDAPKKIGAQLQVHQFRHQFIKQNLAKPAFCDYCSKIILGITQPHWVCKACSYDVHEKCISLVPRECTHHRSTTRYSFLSSSGGHSTTSTKSSSSTRYYIRETRAKWGSEDSTAKNSCMAFLFNDCLIIANILDSHDRPLYFSKVITWGVEDSGGTLKTTMELIRPDNSPFFGVIYGIKISHYKTGITYLFFDTTKDTQEWLECMQDTIQKHFKMLRGEIDEDQQEEEFITN